MTTDPGISRNSSNSNPPGADQAHISDADANHITRHECEAELGAFVDALCMQRPVSTEKAAQFLEHSLKDAMVADANLIENQMRLDQWEGDLGSGETLGELANRALQFLETPQGLRLYNFFAKTYARTTGEIFDKPLSDGPGTPT